MIFGIRNKILAKKCIKNIFVENIMCSSMSANACTVFVLVQFCKMVVSSNESKVVQEITPHFTTILSNVKMIKVYP